ncbi:phage tail sheath family protein [Rhizobium ruizarguesonis]|uniref:phage tail sheath family protein n=1 Tax=Rhizobium leguminosarum TaxID=384 RepID=UPI00041802D3|nr:phage tail sheath C-terminal domain-containing protein [Rhizobium leguminosarum]
MPEYLAPGVYVEEVPSGIKPIEGVSTSTAGFLGPTERGPEEVSFITSFTEYQRIYGGFGDDMLVPDAVKGFFDNGGRRAFIARVSNAGSGKAENNIDDLEVEAVGPGIWGMNVYVLVHTATRTPGGYRLTVAYFQKPQNDWTNPLASAAKLLTAKRSRARPDYFEDYDDLKTFGEMQSTVNNRSKIIRITAVQTQPMPLPSPDAVTEPLLPWVQLRLTSEHLTQPLAASMTAARDSSTTALALKRADEAAKAASLVRDASAAAVGAAKFENNKILLSPAVQNSLEEAIDSATKKATEIDSSGTLTEAFDLAGKASAEATAAKEAADAASTPPDLKQAAESAAVAASKSAEAAGKALKDVADPWKLELAQKAGAALLAAMTASDAVKVSTPNEVKAAAKSADGAARAVKEIIESAKALPEAASPLAAAVKSAVEAAAAAGKEILASTKKEDADTQSKKAEDSAASARTGVDTLGRESAGLLATSQSKDAELRKADVPNLESFKAALKKLDEVDEISILVAPEHFKTVGFDDELVGSCTRLADRVVLLSVDKNGSQSDDPKQIVSPPDSTYAAFYHPWIEVTDPLSTSGSRKTIPSIGHIAGILARSDITRGVHKAPANEVVIGALDLSTVVDKGRQDMLNPKGVNCIRDFRADGRGIRLWGARTTSSDSEWKYLNIRRLFLFIEESIDQGTQWVVFEPNSDPTWAAVRRNVSNFLTSVWRSGALYGTTAEEAFFVKCDRTTMTEDDIQNGRLICVIGVAPVRPAEFVIFQISQKTLDAQA